MFRNQNADSPGAGPPPPNRGNLQEAGPEQPRRRGELGTRPRAPATLVDAIFGRSRTWVQFPPSPLHTEAPPSLGALQSFGLGMGTTSASGPGLRGSSAWSSAATSHRWASTP